MSHPQHCIDNLDGEIMTADELEARKRRELAARAEAKAKAARASNELVEMKRDNELAALVEQMRENLVDDSAEPLTAGGGDDGDGKDWRPARMKYAQAPYKHRKRVLEGLRECRALREARAFMAADPAEFSILVLGGTCGCGKTQAAVWALGEQQGRFVTASELARTSTYKADDLAKLHDPALLVIDDLGTEYTDKRGYFTHLIESVLDHRYANERRTIIATNLPASVFKERYGERSVDRIKESGRYLELADESFRRRRR